MTDGIDGAAAATREKLSALIDGELDRPAVALACEAWREDPEARASWHAYHLIGDVLRSDDLAASAVADARFLAALRSRLAGEPVVLAPDAMTAAESPVVLASAAGRARRKWIAPTAVAAGFMMVASVSLMSRSPSPSTPSVSLATAPARAVVIPASAAAAMTPMVDARASAPRVLIRDPRIDRYLSAHKEFANSTAIGGFSSAFVREASTDAAAR